MAGNSFLKSILQALSPAYVAEVPRLAGQQRGGTASYCDFAPQTRQVYHRAGGRSGDYRLRRRSDYGGAV